MSSLQCEISLTAAGRFAILPLALCGNLKEVVSMTDLLTLPVLVNKSGGKASVNRPRVLFLFPAAVNVSFHLTISTAAAIM